MGHRRFAAQWLKLLAAAGLVGSALVGCSGDDGTEGSAGPSGVVIAPVTGSTALTIAITGAAVSSPPVVNFRVTNQNGESVIGLTDTDFRFNIAKLVPGTYGNPYNWQSYLNRVQGGAVVGTQERKATGSAWGSLVANSDGSYQYAFATDITSAAANPCPAPCTDAAGKPLDLSYQPNLTHRVGIQLNNTALPRANGTYDFVPAGGGVFRRDIVMTGKCNECHNRLAAHGGGLRVETKLCVTCHNPGSWDNSPGNVQTLDFKVMVHKIHRGEELPSVVAGGTYKVVNTDYSTVVFPQDIRNCTKCHDGADPATPQGDNWKIQPSREACGSCHDNVNFATGAGHAGGIKDNSTCLACHSTGGEVGPVADSHRIPVKAESKKYQFNLISVTGGVTPVIQFSVTDPTNANAAYDIASGTSTTNPKFKTPGTSRLAIAIGWNTGDFNNAGSGADPAQPISIDPVNACDGTPIADWTCTVAANVYTLTKSTVLPATATGTGRVIFEGHPAAQDSSGAWTVRVPVKNVFKNFVISGTLADRRQVVDIAKCDRCHDQLSLHGNNRTDEPQVCAMCHNPNATDKARRTGVGVDGKTEESIDFKRMIHAIHAGQRDDPSTTSVVEGYGFRQKGIVVYGFGGSVNNFSGVRFPGILSDCSACHISGSYELTGRWVEPSQGGGILGSTVNTSALLSDASDDLKISPTAAVCSSCHDSASAQEHMVTQGNAIGVGSKPPDTQANLSLNYELCSICHGPGRVADVKVVHGVK